MRAINVMESIFLKQISLNYNHILKAGALALRAGGAGLTLMEEQNHDRAGKAHNLLCSQKLF